MENTKRLLEDERYKSYLKRLEEFESDRAFCRHNLEHFVSVARIAYIHALESAMYTSLISKDLIYFTSLLHDIGRVFEYEKGTPHDEASALIAVEFLKESTFNELQKKLILDCIKEHRGGYEAKTDLDCDENAFFNCGKSDIKNCGENDIKNYNKDDVKKHDKNADYYGEQFIKLFKRSDKESRMCFNCKAYDDCYWSEEKKNHTIKY